MGSFEKSVGTENSKVRTCKAAGAFRAIFWQVGGHSVRL